MQQHTHMQAHDCASLEQSLRHSASDFELLEINASLLALAVVTVAIVVVVVCVIFFNFTIVFVSLCCTLACDLRPTAISHAYACIAADLQLTACNTTAIVLSRQSQ